MTIRVDREGFGQVMDPVAVGVRSSGATFYDDGQKPEPWVPRPWQDKRELAASNTLALMAIPADDIRQIRSPVPYQVFPEQELGFVPEALTIMDVLDTGRWSPQIRSWLAPTIRPPTRSQYQEDVWSGTERNMSMSVNPTL